MRAERAGARESAAGVRSETTSVFEIIGAAALLGAGLEIGHRLYFVGVQHALPLRFMGGEQVRTEHGTPNEPPAKKLM